MSPRFKAGNAGEINEEDDNGEDSINRREKEIVINDDNNKQKRKKRLKFGGCGCKSAKKVVLSPFNKVDKLYKKFNERSSSASNTSNNFSSNYSCCLCLSNPQNMDIELEGIDPNDSNVSYDYMKSLIENNDFYSKECNTHIL